MVPGWPRTRKTRAMSSFSERESLKARRTARGWRRPGGWDPSLVRTNHKPYLFEENEKKERERRDGRERGESHDKKEVKKGERDRGERRGDDKHTHAILRSLSPISRVLMLPVHIKLIQLFFFSFVFFF